MNRNAVTPDKLSGSCPDMSAPDRTDNPPLGVVRRPVVRKAAKKEREG